MVRCWEEVLSGGGRYEVSFWVGGSAGRVMGVERLANEAMRFNKRVDLETKRDMIGGEIAEILDFVRGRDGECR